MTAISKDPALQAVLAAKLQAAVAGATPAIGGAPMRQASARPRVSAGRKQRTSFSERLARAVAGIGTDDLRREQQLLRVFLEAALIDEWGESLLLDPEFPQLVDRVQNGLQDHPELCELAAAVCKLLASDKDK
jgi:hypothetical protein